ncbi:serine/threonine-protein kinase [Streptomyces litchfieldiae]|uniref:non-specific serine/threonine protein kinase n=1 Tax=Streptomyces litchfieldiae TaxID=3075543 RepID=A0ABU2MM38_9ACTN|nr:serine/threonine-protein kinase [Streptomyces sp. DSM 44938]MDT0342433.1 serine/threonine-protein kinase [Streptomyces sp. DSM 44938]
MTIAVGDLVEDRYRLLRRIGFGGMGVVYEARDTALDRRVAVKILTAVAGGEAPERFRREARALARIEAPNTAGVYDFGVHLDTPYLVMEFLDGVDLQTLVERSGRLPDAVVAAVAAGVCSGLAAAHAVGVLHRDVKPSNIRITPLGRVVLQDFGMAWLVEDSTRITRTGALVGTPRYMPPEVILGELPSPAGDLYSLGLCMHLMLTGESPFGRVDDIGAILLRVIDEGAPRLVGSFHGIARELAKLTDALTDRAPAGRPRDAQAVGDLLAPILRAAPDGTRMLGDLVRQSIRVGAVQHMYTDTALGDRSYPEYLDAAPSPPRQPRSPDDSLTLSDVTRDIVLHSMTTETALSRQREAVNLVLRGELQEAMRVLTSVVHVCTRGLGADHPTTLAGQYWQAVCLARLGASGEALALFSAISGHVARGRNGDTTGA